MGGMFRGSSTGNAPRGTAGAWPELWPELWPGMAGDAPTPKTRFALPFPGVPEYPSCQNGPIV